MQSIAFWLRSHGIEKALAIETGKSASLRIEVPKLQITKNFEETPIADLKVCFDAIQELTNLTVMLENFRAVMGQK